MHACRPPVIHRDIKPENVILESGKPGSRVLLVDFGGVQEAVSSSAVGSSFGTTIVGTAGVHHKTSPLVRSIRLCVQAA
jgi:eukaryotic-like serine/threonine-protein kinase